MTVTPLSTDRLLHSHSSHLALTMLTNEEWLLCVLLDKLKTMLVMMRR
ncbi:hypothetical protein OHAE_913 [Ochrobactrum soli]|uniref:Uncharacterized protein n=1 Tax=Ochrobactrum soli TaxID=2448455 RepID=A0A2P9HLR9_9HYPH|nr:hypothetical protein OHAE_913 [[Ochrobactrum] soli]